MATAVNLPGERLAGLYADLSLKLQKGNLTLDQLALFVQHQNPFLEKSFPFPKNEHGHFLIEVTGLNLTGSEEIVRLEAAGFCIGDYAKSMLTSTKPDSYDATHRLEDGKVYKLAIVPGREVKKNRTTANLQAYGAQFGYQKPLAGLIPRICESVTDKQMEQMGIRYIAALHDRIEDSIGHQLVLRWNCSGQISSDWDYHDDRWYRNGAFAFIVPYPGG